MALPTGLANLGASCFLNATLQNLIAVPALRASIATGTTDMEMALAAVLGRLETGAERVVPTEITNVFYRGNQEDAADFLLLLLGECPALHPCLRGLEVPVLRCQHCSFERPTHPEEFLTLQVSLMSDRPLLSIQEALDHYLSYTQLRPEFREWCCSNPECITAERATDPPLGQSKIQGWPEVLVLHLKRWEGVHNVIGHKVLCNDNLRVAGRTYRLQALVAHIGRLATSGHYVAYTRHGAGFARLSDAQVTHLASNRIGDFVSAPEEKVYLAFYVATSSDPPPAMPGRVPPVQLDSDSDSDVIVEQDENTEKKQQDAKTENKRPSSPRDDKANTKKARADFYTPETLDRISSILGTAETLAEALKQLRAEIPGFTTTDTTAAGYMSRSTLYSRFCREQGQAPRSWKEERQKYFKVFHVAPCSRTVDEPKTKAALWAKTDSWSFCPACGRHRPRTQLNRFKGNSPCKPACDPCPESLLLPGDVSDTRKLMAYVTPRQKDWDPLLEALGVDNLASGLTVEDLDTLPVVRLYVDYKTVRGGKAEVTSLKKQSVVRAEWRDRPLREVPRSKEAAAAFQWLLDHNTTYKTFVDNHATLLEAHARDESSSWRRLLTADLLLNRPGIEIAARPWLYPWASYGDTDIAQRLKQLQLIKSNSKPSLRTSWERKCTSRCASYAADFQLQCLLYDTAMARTISTVASLAASKKMAPEAIASDMDTFEAYWQNQIRKMEDICRLEFERHLSMDKAMPSIFLTIAPAEWTFPLHDGIFFADSLSKQQTMLTRHMYHVMDILLQEHLLKEGPHQREVGIAQLRQWSFRYEFQSRGTVHVHCVLWADLLDHVSADQLTGRTGEKHQSALVRKLEDLFNCRVDVQVGGGRHNLMRYVMGYVQKASDALSFKQAEARAQQTPEESHWRSTYRLLCKKAPLEQEMAMEFAGLSMVRHSFQGVNYFAPIPGLRAGRYAEYCFLSWLRDHRIESSGKDGYNILPKAARGRGANKDVGVAMHFPFELLDIFLGAWAATFLVGMDERRLLPDTSKDYPAIFPVECARRQKFEAPEGCRHLKAVLCLDNFQLCPESPDFTPDVNKLLLAVEQDMIIRGLTADRIATFKARINASSLLLQRIYDKKEVAANWSARRIFQPPQRNWSPEQQKVLEAIALGTSIADANEVRESERLLHVKGGPGTGKTEVIIAAAQRAVEEGCRVLIAGPIGLLVSLYRTRLPASPNLTMETLHASFRVTRTADEQYIPPGRLRCYDLIIFDEISQIDAHVWRTLQTALAELHPQPFVVFVGDFQQLQPILGAHQLQIDLERQAAAAQLPTIELQPHAGARSTDPVMLNFLNEVRIGQPSRATLQRFFVGRIFSKDPAVAARQARAFEEETRQQFTFLTVTNRGAYSMNMKCLRLDFPDVAAALDAGRGYPADASSGQERILVEVGMRLRLTRNMDKDRGFVNGNLGTVVTKLRPDVFVVKSLQDVLILVHPVTVKGCKFIPACYAYATTIRRAQGATLPAACLWFDRRRPDRGYAYVGASRVKHHACLFHLGPIRRTDWLPVGGDSSEEQIFPGPFSESSYPTSHEPEDTASSTDPEPEDTASSTDPEPDMSDSETEEDMSLGDFSTDDSEEF
ncbi:Ubiquitin carboxyl-terminal hydrolase 26 [Symbiodinium microadriaticum]|uniref:Ubiquitin carboxyl-terminal hydrolase 26 n=1 Tax=Symbiodinium microadriaticum TaxID=2951 RepID=A0A1Q9CUS1_SYMMI|nr:Ubiquitin carboxyl-terminal hydrolase 26 [Symbiodinium microadriaticum]